MSALQAVLYTQVERTSGVPEVYGMINVIALIGVLVVFVALMFGS